MTEASTRRGMSWQRKPKAEHLSTAYPDGLETNHPHFWLASFLMDLTERAALQALYYEINTPKGPKVDHITEMAVNSASVSFLSRIAQSAAYTREVGLLLYAWPGTKFFDSVKLQ